MNDAIPATQDPRPSEVCAFCLRPIEPSKEFWNDGNTGPYHKLCAQVRREGAEKFLLEAWERLNLVEGLLRDMGLENVRREGLIADLEAENARLSADSTDDADTTGGRDDTG